MSRPTARPLQIVERLAEQIRAHAAAHPELWWQTPNAILLEPKASMDSQPLPLIVFEVTGSEPGESGAIELEQEDLALTLWLLTEDAASPQRALLELLADVRRALIGNRNMIDATDEPWLVCGELIDRGYTLATEFEDGGTGRGLAEYHLIARYQWTPETA